MLHAFDYLVHLLSLAWFFLLFTMVSTLPFHFLDSHGVMEFIIGLSLDFWKVLELGEVVLGKSQGLGVDMVFFGNLSTHGWT